MAIPVLTQGVICVDDIEDSRACSVFVLDAPEGSAWLESATSFRFQPCNGGKPYTVRKESGIYWYGCRKIAGKVRKKYIGKSSEVTMDKLEEIAEALEVPPVQRANKVAEVTQGVVQEVAEVAQDRLTALELQVANLQKSVEALQEALLGKLEVGDSSELPKVNSEVAERLHNELGNLKAENEKLRADYAKLLESSTHVTNKLREEVREVRSQVEAEKRSWDELREELDDSEETCAELRAELVDREKELAAALAEVLDLKQKSATVGEFPDAADLLNQLKAKRKKSKIDLADVETLLDILES